MEAKLTDNTEHRHGLVLCDDLIFASRITGTARGAGIEMKTARSGPGLLALMAQTSPALLILDLANPGLDLAQLLDSAKAMKSPPLVVAYGSHVDAQGLKAARDAGCDLVLPRSKFVEELPTKLNCWLDGRTE
jgi:CheY-like chemotaxis protein